MTRACLLGLALWWACAGCAPRTSQASPILPDSVIVAGSDSIPGSRVQVIDDRGRPVAVLPRARRIASLAPHTTDLVVALGALDRLVAVDPHSDSPQIRSTLPRIAAYPSVDPERLLSVRADLVLAWGEGLPATVLARLESLGLRVFVSQPRSLDEVATSIERVGALIDAPGDPQALAARFRGRLDAIMSRHAHLPSVAVFVQFWEIPLITAGARSVLDDALRRCGARNVFASVQSGSQQVSPEAVLAAAPALVISTVPGSTDARWRQLGLVGEAATDARFVRIIDPVLERPSPPVLDSVERLCELIDSHRLRGGQRPAPPDGRAVPR